MLKRLTAMALIMTLCLGSICSSALAGQETADGGTGTVAAAGTAGTAVPGGDAGTVQGTGYAFADDAEEEEEKESVPGAANFNPYVFSVGDDKEVSASVDLKSELMVDDSDTSSGTAGKSDDAGTAGGADTAGTAGGADTAGTAGGTGTVVDITAAGSADNATAELLVDVSGKAAADNTTAELNAIASKDASAGNKTAETALPEKKMLLTAPALRAAVPNIDTPALTSAVYDNSTGVATLVFTTSDNDVIECELHCLSKEDPGTGYGTVEVSGTTYYRKDISTVPIESLQCENITGGVRLTGDLSLSPEPSPGEVLYFAVQTARNDPVDGYVLSELSNLKKVTIPGDSGSQTTVAAPELVSASYNENSTVTSVVFKTKHSDADTCEVYLLTEAKPVSPIGNYTVSGKTYYVSGISTEGLDGMQCENLTGGVRRFTGESAALYFDANTKPGAGDVVYIAVETVKYSGGSTVESGISNLKKITIPGDTGELTTEERNANTPTGLKIISAAQNATAVKIAFSWNHNANATGGYEAYVNVINNGVKIPVEDLDCYTLGTGSGVPEAYAYTINGTVCTFRNLPAIRILETGEEQFDSSMSVAYGVRPGQTILVQLTAYVTVGSHSGESNRANAQHTLSGGEPVTGLISLNSANTTIELTPDHYEYTGELQKPAVSVLYGGAELSQGTDYTVVYDNNRNEGDGLVTVVGKGSYTDNKTVEFPIKPAFIGSENTVVTLNPMNSTYSGFPVKPAAEVSYRGITLEEGTNYSVDYRNNNGIGRGEAVIVAITGGNFYGNTTAYFTISGPSLNSNQTVITVLDSCTYTGAVQEPRVGVEYNGVTLSQGSDYELVYSDNVMAGRGLVTVIGKGTYCDNKTAEFPISPAPLNAGNTTVALDPPISVYTGAAIEPGVTVTRDGLSLTRDSDYLVEWQNNVDYGTGIAIVKGKGNYDGNMTKPFTINQASVAVNTTISLVPGSMRYTGSPVTQESVTVINNGRTLTDGIDYSLSYLDNTAIGTATILVTGAGNYMGVTNTTFAIAEIPMRTIAFDPNGGSGEMDKVKIEDGTTYVLPECGFTSPAGMTFTSWHLGEPGTEISVSSDLNLTAQYAPYAVIQGEGSSWNITSQNNLTFVISAPYQRYEAAYVDETGPLTGAAQAGDSGITVINLNSTYLRTLPVGSHTLRTAFTDGEVSAHFTTVSGSGGSVSYGGSDGDSGSPAAAGASRGPDGNSPVLTSGTWRKNEDGSYSFVGVSGNEVTGWNYISTSTGNYWYCFDENGEMRTGWYLSDSGKWYYLTEPDSEDDEMAGIMEAGWHFDNADSEWYLLDPTTGEMLVGWQMVNGQWYYLNPSVSQPTWKQDAEGHWYYDETAGTRPYGAMYRNEMTPDGYRVGEDGAWIPNA